MMRLDKYLVAMQAGSRSEVKDLCKKGLVTVNGAVCKQSDIKIDEYKDEVALRGVLLTYEKYRYYMLHKPAGVVTATKDNHDKTVLDLLSGVNTKDLSPAGRLDKDTEGLLLITSDGELIHNLLSPKKHVDKTYYVKTRDMVKEEHLKQLEKGVDIGEDSLTLPARAKLLSEKELLLTICEGKFHQVKRMLQAVDNEVLYLKRMSFGSLTLDENLAPGEFRPLTDREIDKLKNGEK
ncbi:MAG: rRNA pseudouridine synthase [Lachnospiraceae bacterium]|nr:rRNA pseudouridine synthase [Lachnospiraceae bacterium]